MKLTPGAIRQCFEGVVPSCIATCAIDGTPNVAYISQVHYVDDEHVALSFQFFNKTRENILSNPYAAVQVIDPQSGTHYELELEYLRTETAGPLFEHMKARLAAIASHSGMSKVFRLRGSDVYRVLSVNRIAGSSLMAPPPHQNFLAALRVTAQRLAQCTELATLCDELLDCLKSQFALSHTMLLMLDEKGQRLYTVASRGYHASGIGSEIRLGDGVIGVAARERTTIRIGHLAQEYLYHHAVRDSLLARGLPADFETEIPLPGLPEPHSQLAIPVIGGAVLQGVLYAESPQDQRFSFEDEDALVTLCSQLAVAIQLLSEPAEHNEENGGLLSKPATQVGAAITIRRFAVNNSIFINDEYLIKGVAGAILWKLLQEHARSGRTEFTNRELRLDPALNLPDVSGNLEARLVLLQRRISERCDFLRIEKAGRGRLRLRISSPFALSDNPKAAGP